MNEELGMRNEELGINAFAPLGRVLFCSSLPRAESSADGFLPFQGVGLCTEGRLGKCVAWVVRAMKTFILCAV